MQKIYEAARACPPAAQSLFLEAGELRTKGGDEDVGFREMSDRTPL